ncbi:malonate transporter subunit MadL [Fibrella sp. HMF5335]|uniref:Malonate transporter subunit MadL n=1 Tax=Fibrella rubiginis TaxID=2817060 RepID=A0A939K5Y3_9BACT|nr:malonate transporter subunit MadL [Fibrella rubiginis]MBO0938258.1 malonate transporter subunit MadL [Fibrella rubiginis]
MLIRGVALLAGCYLTGQLLGETLGRLLHTNANIGGVGFAMLLLIFAQNWLEKRDRFLPQMQSGILFWSNLYIPVIVAMSATQNVRVALSSGFTALLAGVVPVALCLLFLPLLSAAKPPVETPTEWTT